MRRTFLTGVTIDPFFRHCLRSLAVRRIYTKPCHVCSENLDRAGAAASVHPAQSNSARSVSAPSCLCVNTCSIVTLACCDSCRERVERSPGRDCSDTPIQCARDTNMFRSMPLCSFILPFLVSVRCLRQTPAFVSLAPYPHSRHLTAAAAATASLCLCCTCFF